MRNAILGIVAGLIVGTACALAYSHYLGEGQELADLQAQLTKLKAELATEKDAAKLAKTENNALTEQVQQLVASKDQAQNQDAQPQPQQGPPGVALPFLKGSPILGIVKASLTHMSDARLQMLIARLHLTPDQVSKIKAAMDSATQQAQDTAAKMFSGGKVDLQSLAAVGQSAQSVDQVMQGVLTPDQQTAYQQMQADQKTSAAETAAAVQMNQMAPLLNLNDSQKDQVETALYQAQLSTPDPAAQQQAKEQALAKILTPDQMSTYQQQVQSQQQMMRGIMQSFIPQAQAGAAPQGQ
jgi:hypothetical protein